MNSKIELIARHSLGGELRTTLCGNGESFAAEAQTFYAMRLDGDEIPNGTSVTRQEDELHFKFPDGATFDITNWHKAYGSRLVIVFGAMAYEDVGGKFVAMHSLKGSSFSIFSKTGIFLGKLGTSRYSNFPALASILSRLRLPRTHTRSRCADGHHRTSTLPIDADRNRWSRIGSPIPGPNITQPRIKECAMRCTCNFTGALRFNA